MNLRMLEIPDWFKSEDVSKIWKVDYQKRAEDAKLWSQNNSLTSALKDDLKIGLLIVDAQNTFCIPGFELFVGGRSGSGAVDDNRRLCEFIYRNLGTITQIFPTMDTHQATQIFHSVFLINKKGENPPPYTLISKDDIKNGKWKFNSDIAPGLDLTEEEGQKHLLYYTEKLREKGKYDLTIWPYHAMLGGIGHALVAAIEEAVFFHTIARNSQAKIQIKGEFPLTEFYSTLKAEVTENADGNSIAQENYLFTQKLFDLDILIIAGQAKSHCVAFTVEDLLDKARKNNPEFVNKIYLLEDCMSSVVIPGVIDYTDSANETFTKFEKAGMRIVKSTDPISTWPDFPL